MALRYRKAQRLIASRRYSRRVRNRWRKYGCSCNNHNMRGDK